MLEIPSIEKEIAKCHSLAELEQVRVAYLGKKGLLTLQLRELGQMPKQERKSAGEALNVLRGHIESLLQEKEEQTKAALLKERFTAEQLDLSLPGSSMPQGHPHPLRLVIERMEEVFLSMGFSIVEGPEVETPWYNFEALNTPADHPARDMQDSFYLEDGYLLRTQTSPVQIRTMRQKKGEVPLRVLAPGRVYRRDDDATHSPVFHQAEILVVDKGISMADLKGTLQMFVEAMFGQGVRIRLRPSFFPFTEPSAEVDISCTFCQGVGCRVCKYTGWLEILGSGMVHPQVLRNGGYDPEVVSGFAAGIGPERIAMLYYGIDDIRDFYVNERRFLAQFKGENA